MILTVRTINPRASFVHCGLSAQMSNNLCLNSHHVQLSSWNTRLLFIELVVASGILKRLICMKMILFKQSLQTTLHEINNSFKYFFLKTTLGVD